MTRISFVNGSFLPHDQCFVHIEDRGFQLSDGVYEVILFKNNKLIDGDGHIERLFRSLKELEIKFHQNKQYIQDIILELFKRNNLSNGSVYFQITRGKHCRIQTFPENITSTIVATVFPTKEISREELMNGFSAITHDDLRWGRCDIKSVCLLAGTIAKQRASEKQAVEAILLKDNYVTEGSFSNIFIVDKDNNLITTPSTENILCGITRNRIIDIAKNNNINFLEKKFNKEDLLQAKEVFVTSSTLLIRPIVKIDSRVIFNGKVGQITNKLIKEYSNFIER